MQCRAAIQHADFVSNELGVLSPSEMFESLMAFDWHEETSRFTEMHLLQQETCPPGFYAYRPSDEYLACYPASESRFILHFCVVSGNAVRGKEQFCELTLQPAESGKARAMIEAFATLGSGELLQRLEAEELAEPGVISSEKRSWLSRFLGD